MSTLFSGDNDHYEPRCKVYKCYGRTPKCLDRFIITRENQKQCLGCLKYKNILDQFIKLCEKN